MNETPWYILKQNDGHCEISQIEISQIEISQIELAKGSAPGEEEEDKAPVEQWGPFQSQDEAAARRVGLIRAGKCMPS